MTRRLLFSFLFGRCLSGGLLVEVSEGLLFFVRGQFILTRSSEVLILWNGVWVSMAARSGQIDENRSHVLIMNGRLAFVPFLRYGVDGKWRKTMIRDTQLSYIKVALWLHMPLTEEGISGTELCAMLAASKTYLSVL
jgi:hypothetical protein